MKLLNRDWIKNHFVFIITPILSFFKIAGVKFRFLNKNKTFRKVSVFIDLIMICCIITVFIKVYFNFNSNLSNLRKLDQDRLITAINKVVDDYIQKEASNIQFGIPLIKLNSPQITNHFIVQNINYLEALYSVNKNKLLKKIIYSEQDKSFLAGLDISSYSIVGNIEESLKTNKIIISPLHSSIISGKQSIGFIFPDPPNVLVAEIDIRALFDLIDKAGLLNLYTDSIVLLVSHETNQVMYSSMKDKYPYADLVNKETLKTFGENKKYNYNRQLLKQLGMDLVVLTPESYYLESLNVIKTPFIILIIMVIIFYFARESWINRSVYRPLLSFAKSLKDNPRESIFLQSGYEEFKDVEEAYNNAIKKIDEADKATRESEERYRSLVNNIDLGVTLIDNEHNIIMANAKMVKSSKLTSQDLIGQKCYMIYEKRDTFCPHCPGMIAINQGQAAEREVEQKMANGDVLIWLLKAFPLFDEDGNSRGFIEISEDITEKKRFKLQLERIQRMESINTLAGGIAHDFNNLLMGIQGHNSLLQQNENLTYNDREHIKGIEQCVASAVNLTSQLLGFARGGKYEVKTTDLNDLIHKQCLMFGRTRKEIIIREKYMNELWTVNIDRGQIEQALLNLFVNASHAMPGGGNLIIETINAVLDETYVKPFEIKPGKYVKTSITDSGTGMDEHTKSKIFDPFFTTKEMGRGTGLGLASVYGIVKNHGGFINVYSEKGHGSTFTIYLPASESEVAEHEEKRIELKHGDEAVLLIDDEQLIIEVGSKMLNNLGYKVFTSRTMAEAVEVYKANIDKIDIVILDMIMPGISGSQIFDELMSINPAVKVILSSGYSLNGQAASILKRGCKAFIQKPYNLDTLSRKLREVLDK